MHAQQQSSCLGVKLYRSCILSDWLTACGVFHTCGKRWHATMYHCSSLKLLSNNALTSRDLALVSIGSSHVRSTAMAQQRARVPSASWGCPCSTRSTVRKGDSRAPKREHALHTPKPNDRTWVGYTCTPLLCPETKKKRYLGCQGMIKGVSGEVGTDNAVSEASPQVCIHTVL